MRLPLRPLPPARFPHTPTHAGIHTPFAYLLTCPSHHAVFTYPMNELAPRFSSLSPLLAPTPTTTTTAMFASSSSKRAGQVVTIIALLQYLLALVSLASLVNADCPPDGTISATVTQSRTRVRRGKVFHITITMDQITDWGNATVVYPGVILPMGGEHHHEDGRYLDEGEHGHEDEHDHEGEHGHEEGPAAFRSGNIRPRIWQKSISNKPRVEHEEHMVYYTIPYSYASSAPGPGSLGPKTTKAGAARHAFKISILVRKYAEDEELEFDVGVWDGTGHEKTLCWEPDDHVHIDLFGKIGVDRHDHL